MRLIKKIIINGKESKMFLLDDNKTIQIIFDNEIISSSSKDTWNNIKDEEWAQYGLLKVETESYIKKKNSLNKLKRIAEEAF